MCGREKSEGLGNRAGGMGKVLLCFAGWDCHRNKFQEELLFNSSSSAQRAQLWEPHLHAYGYLIGSVQRYSRSQSDWIWCAYKWSSQSGVWCFRRDRENMLSLLHPKSNRNLGILFFFNWLEISKSGSQKKKNIYMYRYICMYVCISPLPIYWICILGQTLIAGTLQIALALHYQSTWFAGQLHTHPCRVHLPCSTRTTLTSIPLLTSRDTKKAVGLCQALVFLDSAQSKPSLTVFWLIRGQAACGFGWALCLGAGSKHGAVRSVRQICCLGEIWSTLRSWCAPKAIGIIRKMQHHKR